MKKVSLILAAGVLATSAMAADVKGSGASFPYSVYQKWLKAYYADTKIEVDYIKKGSSKGIKDVTKRVVDFGGSDKPLSPKKLKKAKLYQFPAVVGAITMAYNLPNIKNGELKLSDKAIAAISLGKIKYWDNPMITATNEKLNLPHKKLTFVHRADGSGTTFNYTYFLSLVSDEWKDAYGAKKLVDWPGKQHVGGKTNSGVAANVKQTPYSIGYIDYADARGAGLPMASVENRDGYFVKPTLENFQVAAAKASFDPKKDFYSIIAYPAGENSYPMVAATFILLPKEKADMNKKVTKFYDWSFKNGATLASDLGFVPLPSSLQDKIRTYWSDKGIK
ncbi:MAG: phosphate ABC transporter substrate-binding protein PstS [Campylobacterota bacterium]|nr:phosphate ABC transporter substrate-binding protein PstS [Campylobacterota bacterium]